MGYLLGIDVGTSSTKALLCTTRGKIVAEASTAYPLYAPRPGWNEQDPSDWWKGVVESVRRVVRKAGKKGERVLGVGLSGQMHGSVFLDGEHRPVHRAILWNDQRAQEQCRQITRAAGGQAGLIRMVNNPALPGFTAPKILWLRDNRPKAYRKVARVLLPKDYIRLKMTGEFATEVSDASGTLLLDVRRRKWSRALLGRLQIDPSLLPPVFESSEITGTLTRKAANVLGLKAGTPVVGGAGDQPAGAVGMGVTRTGIVSATIGTSGVVFAHANSMVPNPAGLLQSFCHAVDGKWCVFGCMLAAGGSLEWARKVLYRGGRNVLEKMIADAQAAPPGSLGLFFLPYLEGERCPHPDPSARACWIGLSSQHRRDTMIRAVLEGITFGLADQMTMMRESGVRITQVRCGGGGAKSRFWRQLQADVYNRRTVRVDTENAAALGVALLAGVGTGVWRSISEACKEAVHTSDELRPSRKWASFYRDKHKIYTDLYPALKNTFRVIGERT